MVTPGLEVEGRRQWIGLLAVALVSYALCDLLHESAHAAATLLPLGVRALSISTVAVATSSSSPVVAAAGCLANLALGLTIGLSFVATLGSPWRYFWWLFGSLNLFNATGYLLYSAVLDSGDMAVTLRAVAPPLLWRPVAGIVGLGLYAGALQLSRLGLQRLVGPGGVIPPSRIEQCCMIPYWSGGILLVAGAALNPASPWLILTSGAAVGFGAMAGLAVLPRLLPIRDRDGQRQRASPDFAWPWLLAGGLAALIFVGVFGPGVRLGGP
ncbi:MAG: hypothetical protein ACJ76N_22050 [Thermoanaerobaculia bacterium]